MLCTCCTPPKNFNNKKQLSGHIGQQKSIITIIKQKNIRREEYELHPKLCRYCNTPIPYNKKNTNLFCNSSCSAKFVKPKMDKFTCIECNKNINTGKFCSHRCRGVSQKRCTFQKFEKGLLTRRGTIKDILSEIYGYKCTICNLNSWNDQKLCLEVDHIDGNAGNNFPNNLRLLCPNCHSTTDTWKGRNRGKGRKSLGIKTY